MLTNTSTVETTPNREMLKEGTMPKRKPPGRKPNKEVRTREHLTETECEALIAEARKGRNGVRDALLITMLWKHGLRASEATAVEWSDVDFTKGTLYCRRIKGSIASTHPIRGAEMRLLRQWKRDQKPASRFVFTSEQGGPMTRFNINYLVKCLGLDAGLGENLHPHMLRHACGYALAQQGLDLRLIAAYLGHAEVQNSVRYVALSPEPFKNVFRE